MRPEEVLRSRLANHHLTSARLEKPGELVSHLCAVQSQDYAAARWAVGLRLCEATDASVDAAFDRGEILRTHVLRPTWHFVAPADIRWLQQLTAARVKAMTLSFTRRLGLDDTEFARCESVLTHALEGGLAMTRAEIGAVLHISDPAVLGQILMQAELDGLLCSGPRRGRQHTYMLLEERATPARRLTYDEALAELTWRYFRGHGPALVADCVWWSSLPAREIRRGLDLNAHRLASEQIGGRDYWFHPSASRATGDNVHLLPNYDEYTVAYRQRDLYYDPQANWTGNTRMDVPFTNVILVDGRVAGRWRRVPGRQGLEHTWTIEPGPAEQHALAAAEARYHGFFS